MKAMIRMILRLRIGVPMLGFLLCVGLIPARVRAIDFSTAQEHFYTGHYSQCIDEVQALLDDGDDSYHWHVLLIQAFLATGQVDQAYETAYECVNDLFPMSMPLLIVAHDAYQQSDHGPLARMLLERIYRMASVRRLDDLEASDLVAVGQAVLKLGGEPRVILEEFYQRAQRLDPNLVDTYLAMGELALDKQDYELAARQYQQALSRFAEVPDVHVGLARAFYHSDRRAMLQSLDAALVINPEQVGALLLLAEHQIDAEDYDHAEELLNRVLKVNPVQPEAWALKAVLAHLGFGDTRVSICRDQALKHWSTNPQVYFIIGRKLAQKYRFTEAADYQRKALAFDEQYLPAMIQLSEDTLRLGYDEGWKLAEAVYQADQYNVMAYNLVNLRDVMADYRTLTADNLVIRMAPREADIYGDRVVKLLQEAQRTLCDKYGLELDHRVSLELFANQQDFAVRTFGVPGGDGFLGVCFGNVITANSPKLERLSNWEATLWHEFCHVVTLNLTHNKMPRWLSEGISVYEESQCHPTWGQHMNPQYRRMILGGELTPVGQLSSAFLSPATPMHLQFAYYESSLVVEFLIDRFGLDALRDILLDLGRGQQINEALSQHTLDLETLEEQFVAFAQQRAQSLAPEIDWTQPEPGQVDTGDPNALIAWNRKHDNNFWGLTQLAQAWIAQQQWHKVEEPLQRLIELYPEHADNDSAYAMLSHVYRKQNKLPQEIEILEQWSQRSADAVPAYQRLMEIAAEKQQWDRVLTYAERYLAVYPMLGQVYQFIGHAQEALGQSEVAIESYQRLLQLDPGDPVDVNYRLARLYRERDPVLAKRHILEALADAPRFRAGYELLLDMQETPKVMEVIP